MVMQRGVICRFQKVMRNKIFKKTVFNKASWKLLKNVKLNSLLLLQLQQGLSAGRLIQGAIRAFLFAALATKHVL